LPHGILLRHTVVLYVAAVSINRSSPEEIGRTRAYRSSVRLRRLVYVCDLAMIAAMILVVKINLPAIFYIVPLLVAALGHQFWHTPLRQAGIRLDSWGWGFNKITHIVSPELRRQHRRDVFWLPRR
jgi:hypothetical protein